MEKKSSNYKKLAMAFYIIAAIFVIFGVVLVIYNIKSMSTMAANYGMSISDLGGEAVMAMISPVLSYIAYPVVIFGIGKILSAQAVKIECCNVASCEEAAEPVIEEVAEPAVEEVASEVEEIQEEAEGTVEE